MHKNEEFGLVLAGGGTKGAFQVGLWKALKELNINITAIVGASIGALNGALILQDNIEQMEDLYKNININNIMKVTNNIDSSKNIFNISNIKSLAKDYAKQRGLDNEPLQELLEKYIDVDKIYNSKIDFGLITYSVKSREPLKAFKKDILKNELIEYLLASACFPVFKAQKIGKEEYYDGGLYDNIPINLLIEKGYKNIIVADIAGVGFNKKLENKDVYVKVISPSEDLGGTFEFNHEKISHNILLGYLNTMRSFGKLQGHIYYFENKEFIKMLETFSLNTIYGLEYAAQIYKIDKYKIYKCDEFLKLLEEKHKQAEKKYNRIKESMHLNKVLQLKSEVNEIFDKGLGLCLVKDLYMDRPASKKIKYLKHYINDYIISAEAIIELKKYIEN